jgi:diguanylate cyclase (GGDEF)-like protein
LFNAKSTSRSLVVAITALLALVLAAAGLAWHQERKLSAVIERLATVDLQRIERLSEINGHANAAARQLIVLLAAPADQRLPAHAQIAAANQRLDQAMSALAAVVEGGAGNRSFQTLQTLLGHYRQAYEKTARLIEANDRVAAQQAVTEVTDRALTNLITATQAVSLTEQHKTSQRLAAMGREGEQERAWLLALAATSLVLASVLCIWVARCVAAPLRQVAAAARRFAAGDYEQRLPEGPDDEIDAIGTAFNLMASRVHEREQALQHALAYDALTELPRRERFIADQTARVAASGAEGQRLAIVCFDIERLKSINALLGFEAGDQAISLTAARAVAHLGSPARVARLGGGTFGALLEVQPGQSALQAAQALQVAMEHATQWRAHVLDLGVTVGVATGPEHGQTPQELLRRAEQALFEAKRLRCTVSVYNPSIEAARLSHLSLLSELQQAIDRHELVPFLQPKLCARSGRVVGAEALIRWQHPQRGWVSPAEFIPFAERTGRIAAVTRYMLKACIELLRADMGSLHLAVNISTVDLRDPGFVPMVQQLLAQAGVQPRQLLLEVTESGLLDSGEDPVARLSALRALGVGVAIDDFGTGQSSLAYLQRLPVTELKIDRCFVTDADTSSGRQQLLRSIVDMAHSLQLVVTAEGVETEAERAVLQAAGCDLLQGYLLDRPMPVADFVHKYVTGAEPPAPAAPATISAPDRSASGREHVVPDVVGPAQRVAALDLVGTRRHAA